MRKIFTLLTASILSSVSGNPIFNALGKPERSSFSFFISLSKGFPDLSSYAELSIGESLTPFEPGSSLFYFASSSSLFSSSSEPVIESDYFSSPRYGPFDIGIAPNVGVTFTYELNTISSQTIIERVRLFRNGSLVTAVTNGSFSYTKGTRKDVSFTVPIGDYWTTNGLEIRFEIMNASYSVIKSYSAPFYPPKNSQISASTLKSGIYTSNSLGFYGDGQQMRELREIFDFRNIGDYIDNDYYYRLDISRNSFLYPNDYAFTYKSAKLRFNDSGYVFPYYTHQSNDDIEIPLTLCKSSDRIIFEFSNSFYVNKRTLEVSDTYQPDWTVTPYFYLPVNGRKKLNGKMMYFELSELGYDKISTTIPLRYELDRTIIGVCSDGDFCVIGGDR